MKVKTLIKKLQKLPQNADIYSARVFHIGKITIEKERVNMLHNEKMNHKFWERDYYTKKRGKNKLPILKSKAIYTIN